METRKITVVSTKNNSKTVIESAAETLAELKADLAEAGIDYRDMTFYEGLSKTELINDDSQLPKDVMYKGNTTNELVFMLTNSNKKIKSGSLRTDLYLFIKNNELQEEVARFFGKNFTLVKTEELQAFCDKKIEESQAATQEDEEAPICPVGKFLDELINELYENDFISTDLYEKWVSISGKSEQDSKDQVYSSEEINDMFKDML